MGIHIKRKREREKKRRRGDQNDISVRTRDGVSGIREKIFSHALHLSYRHVKPRNDAPIFFQATSARKVHGILIKLDKVADLTTGLRNKKLAYIGARLFNLYPHSP